MIRLDAQASRQVRAVAELVGDVLGDAAVAGWLFGSAVHGGLKPSSDLDILVLTDRPTTRRERGAIVERLLPISGSRAAGGPARSIELTGVVDSDVHPWRYPPRLDFQYGDWWRSAFEDGDLEPWEDPNPDLAILLATANLAAVPVLGDPAAAPLVDVPPRDLVRAILDSLPALLADLDSDTRNVLLTLARAWVTVATGRIEPKDESAEWVLPRLDPAHRPVLAHARSIYRGEAAEDWTAFRDRVHPTADALLAAIRRAVGPPRGP